MFRVLSIKSLAGFFQKLSYKILISPKIQLGGKFPDMIAIKGNEIVAIEIKSHVTEITTAIGQCLFYVNDSTKVYVAIPKHEFGLVSKNTLNVLRNAGIGLIGYGDKSDIFIEAKRFDNFKEATLANIEKNFVPRKQIIPPRNIAEIIENLLKDHPEGLTTTDLSKISGLNRITISKYLFGLLAKKKVEQRRVGSAKLNFLR